MQMFPGTGVALVTPFTNKGDIDLIALKNIVRHCIDGGVDYLVALGTTGEVSTLSDFEKEQVFETILEENNGQVPIILGSGGNNTQKVCSTIQYFQGKFDFDGILSVSPYYNKPSQSGLISHYTSISHSTNLPIILYNVPGRTSVNIEAKTIIQLAKSCSNIIAVKEASGNMIQCMEIIRNSPRNFSLISGDDILTLPLMMLGAKGVISVIANAFPTLMSKIVRQLGEMRHAEALEVHYQIFPSLHMTTAEGNPTGIKAILSQLELCLCRVRLPLADASDQLKEEIKRIMVPLIE